MNTLDFEKNIYVLIIRRADYSTAHNIFSKNFQYRHDTLLKCNLDFVFLMFSEARNITYKVGHKIYIGYVSNFAMLDKVARRRNTNIVPITHDILHYFIEFKNYEHLF